MSIEQAPFELHQSRQSQSPHYPSGMEQTKQQKPSSTAKAEEEGADEDPSRLAIEVESRLHDYLAKAALEYPAGCQADWLAGEVAGRLLRPTEDAATSPPPTLDSLVKLCVYLMESLADVSTAYEDFYAQQMAGLRDEAASAHAQVAGLEDENGRLREQLHRRAEELRRSQASVDALRAGGLAAAAAGHSFDEAVDVEDVDEDDSDTDGCRRCVRLREAAERSEVEAAGRTAALKADLADWEADMAEKVHQNVELTAQLENCQRMLARLGHAPAAAAATSRGLFGGGPPLLRKK